MAIPVSRSRRENLDFLCRCHGSQSQLARVLADKCLTQPIVSSILRRKRRMRENEARDVERKLNIPNGWMDRCNLRKTAPLIREFRALHPSIQELFNSLLDHVQQAS